MSIYSVNRTGSMALAQVVANESYKSEDIGRILYETQVNDMAFFEAVLACDFNELKSMREGTLLESEVASLNEAAFGEMVSKLVEKLKAFWSKLKAIFQNAIEKIAAYALNDGKAFVNQFKKSVGEKVNSWNGKVEKVETFNLQHKCFTVPNHFKLTDMVKRMTEHGDSDMNTAELVGWELAELVGATQPVGIKDYAAKAHNVARNSPEDLTSENVNEYCDAISKANARVLVLKQRQRDAEKSINNAMKELKDMAKGSENEKESIVRINSVVSAYETYVATICKTGILVVREDMKSRRVALAKAMADINKSTKELSECVVLEAVDEFDAAMTDDLNLDAETKTAVDELVNAEV